MQNTIMESADTEDPLFPSSCALCQRLFKLDRGLKPKLLPCLHTFCDECIKLQCKEERFTCPLDSQECRNVQGVMDQYFVLEKLSRDELTIDQSNNSCEGCVADENGREQLKPSATGFCKQCSDWLCDSCIAAHRKVRVTKDHEILSHDEYKANTSSECGKWRFCEDHPNQMICLFCEPCQILTCRSCHSDSKHLNHQCQFLNLKASVEKSTFVRLTEEVSSKQEGVKKQHVELSRHKTNVKVVQQTVSDQIESCFRDIYRKLDARKNELLQAVVSQCNEAEKRIEIQSERLTKVQNIMRFAVLFAQRAVALEEAFPLMKSRIAVLSQLKNLTKIPLESLTVEQVDIKFSSDGNCVDSFLKSLGTLVDAGKVQNAEQKQMRAKDTGSTNRQQFFSQNVKKDSDSEGSMVTQNSSMSPISSVSMSRGRGKPRGTVNNRGNRMVLKTGPSRGRPPKISLPTGARGRKRAVVPRKRTVKQEVERHHETPNIVQAPVNYSPNEVHGSPIRNVLQSPGSNSFMSPGHQVTSKSPVVAKTRSLNENYERSPARVKVDPHNQMMVPGATFPRFGPPARFQQGGGPPTLVQQPRTPPNRTPPHATNHMVSNEQLQHWKSVFMHNSRPESEMDQEQMRMQHMQAAIHDQVVYEKRYQEYAMRTNMIQGQQHSPAAQEQMIIRTATEYVRPNYQRSSSGASSGMLSPGMALMPPQQPSQMWQPRMGQPHSPGRFPYDAPHFMQDFIPYSQPQNANIEDGFMITGSGLSPQHNSPALPSVSSLSRAVPSDFSPRKKRAIEYPSSMQSQGQTKNEMLAAAPSCAIVELGNSSTDVDSQYRRSTSEASDSNMLSNNSHQIEWSSGSIDKRPRGKAAQPEVIELDESSRHCPADWSNEAGQQRPASAEETALACELMRSVDSAQDLFDDRLKSSSNDLMTVDNVRISEESIERSLEKGDKSTYSTKQRRHNREMVDSGIPGSSRIKRDKKGRDDMQHDEWCAVCADGGELILCDTCPKIYHLECHVPALTRPPTGDFSCTLCRQFPTVIRSKLSAGKRAMTNDAKKLCEKVLLLMYTKPEGEDFHKPVPLEYEEYYEAVSHPVDFSHVRKKLAHSPTISLLRGYTRVGAFLEDMRRVFDNAIYFNGSESELGKIACNFLQYFSKISVEILGFQVGPCRTARRPVRRAALRNVSDESEDENDRNNDDSPEY